jgi:hypothetical protein
MTGLRPRDNSDWRPALRSKLIWWFAAKLVMLTLLWLLLSLGHPRSDIDGDSASRHFALNSSESFP